VVPGFMASDESTGILRRYLKRLGHASHPWLLGRNLGSPNFVRYVQASAEAGDGVAGTARREFLANFREHDLTIEERTGGRFGTDTGSFDSSVQLERWSRLRGHGGGVRRERTLCF
jgi:hypothetical protein